MKITEGHTADIDFPITTGAGAPWPWSGCTVALVLKNRDGEALNAGTNAQPVDGTLRWSPATVAAGGMTAAKSPCYLHIFITKSGKDTPVPMGPAIRFDVSPVAAKG